MKASGVLALVAIPAVLLGGCMSGTAVLGGAALARQQAEQARCAGTSPGALVDVAGVPTSAVAGYSGEQLVNAAHIMNAGAQAGLSVRDQTIGVMTAMGESSLRNIDYGDWETRGVRNADGSRTTSLGLFQQQGNGAWGSYADRMDPSRSATSFFRVLAEVEGREQMAPTRVANRVQRNDDPEHYTRWWDPAVAVVDALTTSGALASSGAAVLPAADVTTPATAPEVPAAPASTSRALCEADAASIVPVAAGGWTRPAEGRLSSSYGMRFHPTKHVWRLHGGIDLAPGCAEPVRAAASGVVARSGPAASYGTLIVLDHGGGVSTYYAHAYSRDLLVGVGEQVAAGQQIARVGSAGDSSGCHLHFEVRLDGERTDPAPFLAARSVSVG
ncbi:M23 family metallopeptidase [uncultured Pseudokineococcus sp.]|uniref:M23 family metallopeptidase n=1 Tax=uncultured Pseudokineococcus sp. TaxID=1642928 RepID=UPI0026144ABA|nr:M23 family metallopeptidase [uncultured Pseudokineococcus sp.]